MGGRVEVLGVGRRRRWTPEEKVAILDEAFGVGGSVAAASERRGVSRALIYCWRRQARDGDIPGVGVREPAVASFVPVRIESGPMPSARPEPPGAPCTSRRQPRAKPRAGRLIEIALANGRIVSVEESIEPLVLARLVDALDGGRS